MQIDTSGWSGDGDFTIRLLEILRGFDDIALIRLEDAPASRSGAGFNLLANEFFLTFGTEQRSVSARWLGLVPVTRRLVVPRLTLAGLERRLQAVAEVGPPDYTDEGMLQYLRAERVVAPHQSRGYKLVELVRIYDAEAGSSRGGLQPTARDGL